MKINGNTIGRISHDYTKITPNITELEVPYAYAYVGVAYGDGKYVAICNGKAVGAYSTDGINWEVTALPTNAWHGLAYGNGQFIACISSEAAAYTSYDGKNWSTISLPVSSTWHSIHYVNGKWIIGDMSGGLVCSEDGTNWTSATISDFTTFYTQITSIAYGNGKYIATISVYDNTLIAYSTDGVTWATYDTGFNIRQVAFENGRFVAINTLKTAFYSVDGFSWTEVTLPFSNMNMLSSGNGMFVVAGKSQQNFCYSSDGINWTTGTFPKFFAKRVFGYCNDKFLLLPNTGTVGYAFDFSKKSIYETSSDDVILSPSSNSCFSSDVKTSATDALNRLVQTDFIIDKRKMTWVYPWSSIAYGDGSWVAVANNNKGHYSYSTDNGVTWTTSNIGAAHPWTDVIYADGKFVTVGAIGSTSATGEYPVAYSANGGVSWSYDSDLNSIGTEWSSISYGDGKYVAFNTTGTTAAYSTNLTTWTSVTLPTPLAETPLYSTYGNGTFVAVGNCYAIYSEDGEYWTESNMGSACAAICFGADKFVTVGIDGYICYSDDGITWTPVFLGDDEIVLSTITYGDNGFIALREFSTEAYFSKDGVNWDIKTVGQIEPWTDITFGDGKYMAVNNTQYNVYTFTFEESSDFVTKAQFDKISSFQKIAEKAHWYDGDLDYLNMFTESGFYPLSSVTLTGQTTGTDNYTFATSSPATLMTFTAGDIITQIISASFGSMSESSGPYLFARNGTEDTWSSTHKILTTHDTHKTFPAIDIGSYTGGGTSDVEITTGFAPRFILIHCVGTAYSNYKTAFWLYSSSKKQSQLCRIDSPSSSVSGVITTTSTGFTVAGSSSPYMNYSGAVHVYLALRG